MGVVRRYRYVGPADLREQPPTVDAISVDSVDVLADWLRRQDDSCTFVVAIDGRLRLAPRRSEHVRRCPGCGERNVVRDGDFTCALCDGALPARWNFPTAAG